MFVPLSERETPTIRRLDHACDTCYIRQLCIVDVNGKIFFVSNVCIDSSNGGPIFI